MIVKNLGYLSINKVLDMVGKEHFSIYETQKKTAILVKKTSDQNIHLYYPKKDRLPYKTIEGKKIIGGRKMFDSNIDDISAWDKIKWNNGNQIMAYEEFYQPI